MFRDRRLLPFFVLLIIFFLASFLRFYRLGEFPAGFHIDEASLGYNGYSLLLTGKDENNNPYPLYIDMFGDNRPSGYHYLTILPIKFLGLTELATRFPGALFGSISIFAFYFLAISIFSNKKLALLSSFFVAIAPWHIVLSRASGEAVVALFFIVSGFGLIVYSIQNQRFSFLFYGTFLVSCSFFFYHTPRVFVPPLFLSLFLFLFPAWRRYKNKRYKIALCSSVLFLSILSFLLVFVISGGTGRYNQVNIFSFPQTKLILAEQIREDGVSGVDVLTARSFHNKLTNYSLTFVSNYLEYFSGGFLFIKGGLPIWYNVPGMGVIYLVELPFIVLGIILLALHKKMVYKIPLIWLLIAPITAAITVDDTPNVNRVIVMFAIIELIAAYGMLKFLNIIQSRVKTSAMILIGVFLLFNLLYFLHQYFVHAPIHNNWYRNEGFGEMVNTIKNSYDNVDKIVVTKDAGGIYPLILFYMRYDPRVYQLEGSPKDRDYTGFGKFFFVPQSCPSVDKDDRFSNGHFIYVDNGTCPDNKDLNDRKKAFINRKDGTRAFKIVYDEYFK